MVGLERGGVLLPVALAAVIGASACGGGSNPDARALPTPSPSEDCPINEGITAMHFTTGNTYAVNDGECVGTYDPATYKKLGEVAHDQYFFIQCKDPAEPTGLRVIPRSSDEVYQEQGWKVNLSHALIAKMGAKAFSKIPVCRLIEPEPSEPVESYLDDEPANALGRIPE